jgi:SAM-dependent methyltransferase
VVATKQAPTVSPIREERLAAAWSAVRARHPYAGLLDQNREACLDVARTVSRFVPPGSSILDFGAGAADKTAVLQQLGYVCSAYDDLADPWHTPDRRTTILSFAESAGIDYLTGTALPDFGPAQFDIVMLHDVLEHLHSSPRELLLALVRLIRGGGFLYATVPSAVNIRKRIAVLLGKSNYQRFDWYYWSRTPYRGHIREYARDDLERLARYLCLERVELDTRHHWLTPGRLPRSAELLYRGATRLRPGWRDTWSLVARKPHGWSGGRNDVDTDLVVADAVRWLEPSRQDGAPDVRDVPAVPANGTSIVMIDRVYGHLALDSHDAILDLLNARNRRDGVEMASEQAE